MKKREHLVNLEVDERAILEWTFRNMTENCELFLAQGLYQWWALDKTTMKIRFSQICKVP